MNEVLARAEETPILLFPTHYLGNFVLGLPWVLKVLSFRPEAPVVLDARFGSLARLVLPEQSRVILYPRQQMAADNPIYSRVSHFWRFLTSLRGAGSQVILDLEGERFTGILARLSGCPIRVGPVMKRAGLFYTEIRDLNYQNHRFNAFGEIVADFVDEHIPATQLPFRVDRAELDVLRILVPDWQNKALVAIHPGASVSYKLWSQENFAQLASQLQKSGFQVVWVGAGDMDAQIITAIQQAVETDESVNLCNCLSFPELIALYQRCRFFIGNDSGPMHLAAASGVPVFALFGPSDKSIWAPLGEHSHLLSGNLCLLDDCIHCRLNHRCMESLHPKAVIEAINDKLPIEGDKT
ncbi:MAG TPA: hypothetical protein DEF79_05490 [Gammaproteobacteria bacterium]|nr:hypothetical protein [Gammaproteobacteria bacterium]